MSDHHPWPAQAARAAPGGDVHVDVFGVHVTGVAAGMLFGIVPALIANLVFGVGFSAPLDERAGPASLRWFLILAAVAVALTAYGALARRPVWAASRVSEFEMALPLCEGALIFWLWLHGAYALLWPAVAFALCYMFARMARWEATEIAGPEFVSSAPAKTPVGTQPSSPGAGAAASAEPSPAEQFPAVRSSRTFADVLGMEREKRALLEFARETQAGRKNGALLFGPPGAGKSYLVSALAGELKLPLCTTSVANFASKWVNQSTENLARAFAAARAQSPCLLFLDEIDAVMPERGAMGADAEGPRIVATLLTELTAIRELKAPVIVLAATNFPERLDAAGKREGRFDVKIEIGLPDNATRRALLAAGLGEKNPGRIRPGTLEMGARHFAGFSVARLQAIASRARKWLDAERDPSKMIGFTVLLQALRQVQGLNLASRYEAVPGLGTLVLGGETREEIERLAEQMRDIEHTERSTGMSELEHTERPTGKVPLGAVFYGPPGTGKTLTAKALAKASGWAFIATTGHDLVKNDQAMDELIARASDERPVIVFIDEADDILGNRAMSPHVKMSTNKLFTLIDGERGRIPDVFYIAATNHPEALDEAAVRRFPKKIEFALPGAREIERYVREWMDRMAVGFAPEFTPAQAARLLAGRSVADAGEALQEAVNIALAEHRALRPGDLARAVRSLCFAH